MANILVTPRSISEPAHPALRPLLEAGHTPLIPSPGKLPTPEVLRDVLPKCEGWLAGVEPITAELMDAGQKLRIIARNGVGVDNVDLVAAKARGIEVAVTPGANSRGVAELALGLILNVARGIGESDRSIRAGGWGRTQGFELQGKTLGLAGCGQIGKLLAGMALGIGMRVVAYDIMRDPAMAARDNFHYAELDEMLRAVDVLSLHMPADKKPFLDAERLAMLKKGVVVVNTARAALVDQEAILSALDAGQVRGYAVDVFDPEPPGETALTRHPKVLCSAHLGGFTAESVLRAGSQAAENIVRKLGG